MADTANSEAYESSLHYRTMDTMNQSDQNQPEQRARNSHAA